MLGPLVLASFAAVVSAKALDISPEERAALIADLAEWQKEFGSPVDLHIPSANQEALLERLKDAKDLAAELNKKNPAATFSHMTKFALLTEEEFQKKLMASYEAGHHLDQSPATLTSVDGPGAAANGTVDWTTSGCVNPVKDQGNCGNCWTFATAGAIESAHCIATGTLLNLSEQHLTSCDKEDGDGCLGGLAAPAIDWVVKNGGLCLTKDYPYTSGSSGNTGTCQNTCTKQKLSVGEHISIKGEDNLTNALNKQPLAVRVDAHAWKLYKNGILTDCDSKPNKYGHAVIAVGYGTDNGKDYYKIRNSWGGNWGEQGHIRVQRNVGSDGTCNIAGAPSFPKIISAC